MFSKACEYGIRSVLFIARQSKTDYRVNIAEISNAIESPEAFTAKICQQLVRAGILLSKKGPTGGFYLAEDSKVNLTDIVMAIDGGSIFEGCGLGLPECNAAKPCAVHKQFAEIRKNLKDMCDNTLVTQIENGSEDSKTFLKRI